jgi:hypothetical protein
MEADARIWDQTKALLAIGDTVSCIVKEHHPFGLLVSLEQAPLDGVIERIGMAADGFQTPDEYPPIGSVINATVLGFRDYSRQIELAMLRKCITADRQVSIKKYVEVGLRIGDDGRLNFFGIDDINEMLTTGNTVVRIEKGRAIMVKSGESQDSVKMQLRGFSVLITVSAQSVLTTDAMDDGTPHDEHI